MTISFCVIGLSTEVSTYLFPSIYCRKTIWGREAEDIAIENVAESDNSGGDICVG